MARPRTAASRRRCPPSGRQAGCPLPSQAPGRLTLKTLPVRVRPQRRERRGLAARARAAARLRRAVQRRQVESDQRDHRHARSPARAPQPARRGDVNLYRWRRRPPRPPAAVPGRSARLRVRARRLRLGRPFAALTAVYFGWPAPWHRIARRRRGDTLGPTGALLIVDARHPGLAAGPDAWAWLCDAEPGRPVSWSRKIDKLSRAERDAQSTRMGRPR